MGSKIDFDTFCKSEFLTQNYSEIAPGTRLVGFSRSDSEGFVYSKNDFDTVISKVKFTWDLRGSPCSKAFFLGSKLFGGL